MKILDNLTPREAAILDLLAEGYSNAKISQVIGTDISSIKTHMANIFQKLHVENRTQAAMVIWQMKLEAAETERDELRARITAMQPEVKALLFYMLRAVKLFTSLAEDSNGKVTDM